MTCTVVIPTLNAGPWIERQIRALKSQTTLADLVILDSSSTDDTANRFAAAGARVEVIPREAFHHATTRSLGASMATGEYVAFLTQDAVPADENWLSRLLTPLVSDAASASYSRQLAWPEAKPTERYARLTNYPPASRLISFSELATVGVGAQFFSNSASAVRLDVLQNAGWFPTGTVQNEDMLLASRLLNDGHVIAYVADSLVYHSHNLSIAETFRRYFDIGTVLADAGDRLVTSGLSRRGLSYAFGLLRTLVATNQLRFVPEAAAETAAKAMGSMIGRKYHWLPKSVLPTLSGSPSYWRRSDDVSRGT